MSASVDTHITLTWQGWFRALLLELRRAYLQLPIDDRGRVAEQTGMQDYRRALPFAVPTQLIVIWVRDSATGKEFQLVQVEHFENLPNEDVAVYGPFGLESYAATTMPILEELRWKEQQHHDKPFVTALEDRLVTAYSSVQQYLDAAPGTSFFSPDFRVMRWYPSDIAIASFGDVRRVDPSKIVVQLLQQALSVPRNPFSEPPEYNAVGSVSYRPFWIEEQPKATYRERLDGIRPKASASKVWQIPYGDTATLAWQGGLIAVRATDLRQGLHSLNVLMAVLNLMGLPMGTVSEHDAFRLQIEQGTWRIERIQSRMGQDVITGGWLEPPTPSGARSGVLVLAELERAVRKAEQILSNSDLAALITLHAQADVLAETQDENTAAFLFGWIILERCVYRQIASMPFQQSRKNKLAKFSVDPLLEILEAAGQLPVADYSELMHWKTMRNHVVHEGKEPPPKETRAILKYSREKLNVLAGITDADRIRLRPLMS